MKHSLESFHYPIYGDTVSIKEVAGITLSETSYHPCLNIPLHVHEDSYFNLILQGGYRESSSTGEREFGPAMLVFHPLAASHANQFSRRRTRLFNIRFDSGWLRRVHEHEVALRASASFADGLLVQLAVRLYREFAEMDSLSPLVIEGLALEMLAEASRRSNGLLRSSPPRWLFRAKEMLHAEFRSSVRLSDVAQAVGVHPFHLNRVFRQHFHCTVGEYIRQLRIDFACRKLATSQATLTEIGMEAGFSDQSHFSRTFKGFMGLTPTQYRAAFGLR